MFITDTAILVEVPYQSCNCFIQELKSAWKCQVSELKWGCIHCIKVATGDTLEELNREGKNVSLAWSDLSFYYLIVVVNGFIVIESFHTHVCSIYLFLIKGTVKNELCLLMIKTYWYLSACIILLWVPIWPKIFTSAHAYIQWWCHLLVCILILIDLIVTNHLPVDVLVVLIWLLLYAWLLLYTCNKIRINGVRPDFNLFLKDGMDIDEDELLHISSMERKTLITAKCPEDFNPWNSNAKTHDFHCRFQSD